MKIRYIIALIGVPLILVVGFFLWVSWIFVVFEHRENHNGVGYNAFRKSILNHVKGGPHRLSDMTMYEGTWWFTLTDPSSNSYRVTLGRDNFMDARDMLSLKRGHFEIQKINAHTILCENNFGEPVRVGVKLADFNVSEEAPSSLNRVITNLSPKVIEFRNSLPLTFGVVGNDLSRPPTWLRINLNRSASCCGAISKPLEPPTSVTCYLDKSKSTLN